MDICKQITNEFLQTHLEYTEHTESPKIMHIWSALAAASACMQRHVWLDFGIGKIYPNIYTLLVGPPGTRKSKAISYSRKLLKDTPIRFAPDDTSGQRQGLIAAIEGTTATGDADMAALDASDAITQAIEMAEHSIAINQYDRHTMYVCASEFGSFIGENSKDMIRFLIKMYDGENYDYQLKNSNSQLKEPLLTIIGGTTTTDITTLLPPEAIGQGFMSRIILVFAPNKYKRVARPRLNMLCAEKLKTVYNFLAYDLTGEMQEEPAAAKLLDKIYANEPAISDLRFIYYTERRQTHLMKIAMILAATRMSNVITIADVSEADLILQETEITMPEALGEYGLSPLSVAKQKMAEFIQHAKTPVLDQILWIIMQRDMKHLDYRNSLNAMINAGKIYQVDTKDGPAFVYNSLQQQAIDLLAEG